MFGKIAFLPLFDFINKLINFRVLCYRLQFLFELLNKVVHNCLVPIYKSDSR